MLNPVAGQLLADCFGGQQLLGQVDGSEIENSVHDEFVVVFKYGWTVVFVHALFVLQEGDDLG